MRPSDRGLARRRAAVLVAFAAVAASSGGLAEAVVSQADNRRLDAAETNQGGEPASSPTSARRVMMSFGEPFEGRNLTGTQFLIRGGFLGAAIDASRSVAPPDQLDIRVLTAKTRPLGTLIAQRSWQRDRDPYFEWEPPATGLPLAGYSHTTAPAGSGCAPDETIDTVSTWWDASRQPFADGARFFCVKAINTAGSSGKPATFELWVDTVAPTVTIVSPTPGDLINARERPALVIGIEIADAHSGIDAEDAGAIALSVDGVGLAVSFDPGTKRATASGAHLTEGAKWAEAIVTDQAGNATDPALVWGFTVDLTPPSGSVLINGGLAATASAYVTLNLQAEDRTSGVAWMRLSNDPGFDRSSREVYTTVRESWQVNPVSGRQTVYATFEDKAGNLAEPVSDDIELELLAPETRLISGPAGASPHPHAEFAFGCSETDCVFSYAFDHEPWSDWTTQTTAVKDGLVFGNHYFKVKAAKDTNGQAGIQADEEDPTPAERTWIVGLDSLVVPLPQGGPIKLWKVE